MKNTLLIVEDNADFYKNLFNVLSAKGFKVLPFTPTYEDAVDRIAHYKPDLALLDIELKGDKNGYDVAEYINKTSPIPLIFLTRYDDQAHFHTSLPYRPNKYLSKAEFAFNPDSLLREITLLLLNNSTNQTSSYEVTRNKIGILALPDFLDELRFMSITEAKEIKIPYKNIVLVTIDQAYIRNFFKKEFKENYSLIVTDNFKGYLIRYSLSDVENIFPDFFKRINEKYVVNIRSEHIQFLKRHKYVQIKEMILPVTKTYWKNLDQIIKNYYDSPKKS